MVRSLVALCCALIACGGSDDHGGPSDAGPGDGPISDPGDAGSPDPTVWLGTVEIGSTDNDTAYGAAVDAQGQLYVVGGTHGKLADEGDGSISQWFVTHLSASGRRLWTRQFSSGASARVAVLSSGSLAMAGPNGVVRMDGTGALEWHALVGADVRDVSIGPDGDVYVGGLVPNQTVPGTLPPIGPLGGTYDGFLARLDAATGATKWRIAIGTTGNDWINGVAVGAGGEIYVAGATNGVFPNATDEAPGPAGRGFLMRIGPDGQLAWTLEGLSGEAVGVRLDHAGAPLAIAGRGTAALSKHDPATGARVWTLRPPGAYMADLAFDATGKIWLACTLGLSGTSAGVLVVDANGTVVGRRVIADAPSRGMGAGDLYGQSGGTGEGIAIAPDGAVYLVGETVGDLAGNYNASTLMTTATPGEDAFVAKLGADLVVEGVHLQPNPTLLALAAGAQGTVGAVAIDARGAPVTAAITWSSITPAIATVDAAGHVTAIADGRTDLVPHLDRLAGAPATVKVGGGGHAVMFGTDHSDIPQAVALAPDGTLLVGGWTNDAFDGQTLFGNTDAFLTKVASSGDLAWVEQRGDAGSDALLQMVVDPAGNTYAVAELSTATDQQLGAFSTDAQGHHRWTYVLPPLMNETHTLTAIARGADGRLYVGGSSQDEVVIVELDPATGLELSRVSGAGVASGGFKISNIAVDAHGDLLAAGARTGNQSDWGMVMKIDRAAVATTWSTPTGNGVLSPPRAFAVGSNGAIYVGAAEAAGAIGENSGPYQGIHATVSRISPTDGTFTWQTKIVPIGGTDSGGLLVNVAGLAVGADGSIYAAGSTTGAFDGGMQGGFDALLVKLDPTGAIVWTRQFGTASNDYATALAIDASGDLAVVGYTFGDLGGASLRGFRDPEACDVFITRFGPDGTRR